MNKVRGNNKEEAARINYGLNCPQIAKEIYNFANVAPEWVSFPPARFQMPTTGVTNKWFFFLERAVFRLNAKFVLNLDFFKLWTKKDTSRN